MSFIGYIDKWAAPPSPAYDASPLAGRAIPSYQPGPGGQAPGLGIQNQSWLTRRSSSTGKHDNILLKKQIVLWLNVVTVKFSVILQSSALRNEKVLEEFTDVVTISSSCPSVDWNTCSPIVLDLPNPHLRPEGSLLKFLPLVLASNTLYLALWLHSCSSSHFRVWWRSDLTQASHSVCVSVPPSLCTPVTGRTPFNTFSDFSLMAGLFNTTL